MQDPNLAAQSAEPVVETPALETPAPEMPSQEIPEAPVEETPAPEPETAAEPMLKFSEWVAKNTGDGTSEIEKQFAADPREKYRGYSGYVRQSLLERGEWDDEVVAKVDEQLAGLAVQAGDYTPEDPEKEIFVQDILGKPKSDDLPLDSLLTYTSMGEQDDLTVARSESVARLIAMKENPELATPEAIAAAEASVREWATPETISEATKTSVANGRKLAALVPPAIEGGAPDVMIHDSLLEFVRPDGSIDDKELGKTLKLKGVDPELIPAIRQKLSTPAGYKAPLANIEKQSEFVSSLDTIARTRDPEGKYPVYEELNKISKAIYRGGGQYLEKFGLDRLDRLLKGQKFWDNASPEQRLAFINDYAKSNETPEIDKERPELALRTLSTGEVVAPLNLMLDDKAFEKAVKAVPPEQVERLRNIREAQVEANATQLIKTISANPQGGAEFTKFLESQPLGRPKGEIVKEWVSNQENFSAGQSYGTGVAASLKDAVLPFVYLTTPGSGMDNFAMREMVKSQQADNNRREYASLFGYKHGLGYDLGRLVAPVAADLAVARLTGGLSTVATGAARATVGGVVKTAMRESLSSGTKTMMNSWIKSMARSGAESLGTKVTARHSVDEVISLAGRDIVNKIGTGTGYAAMQVTGFNRSATSTYASLHSTLSSETNPDGSPKYTDAEVKEIAGTHALVAGTITAAVVGGFQALGAPGLERVLDRGLTKTQLSRVYSRMSKDVGKIRGNIDMSSADAMLKSMIRETVVPLAKSAAVKGFKEEALEEGVESIFQSVNMALATGESVNIADVVKNAAYEGLLGGVMGGTITGAGAGLQNRRAPSAEVEADIRREKLLEIAGRLDATSPQTAQVLRNFAVNQRRLFPEQAKLEAQLGKAKGEEKAQIQEQINQLNTDAAQDPKQRITPAQEVLPQDEATGGAVPTPSDAGVAEDGVGVPTSEERATTAGATNRGELTDLFEGEFADELELDILAPAGLTGETPENDTDPETEPSNGGTLSDIAERDDKDFEEDRSAVEPLLPSGLKMVQGDKFGGYQMQVSMDGTELRVPPGFIKRLKQRFKERWESVRDLIIDEELFHHADMQKRGGGQSAEASWSQEWQDSTPEIKKLFNAAYRGASSLDSAQKGAEISRMKDQAARLGRVTESESTESTRADAANKLAAIFSQGKASAPSPVTTESPTGSLPEGQAPTSGDVGAAPEATAEIDAPEVTAPKKRKARKPAAMREKIIEKIDAAQTAAANPDLTPEQAQVFQEKAESLKPLLRDAEAVIQAEGEEARTRAVNPDGTVKPSADPADIVAIAEAEDLPIVAVAKPSPMAKGTPVTFTSIVPGTTEPTQGVIERVEGSKVFVRVGKTVYPNATIVSIDTTEDAEVNLDDIFFEMPADYPLDKDDATLLSAALVAPAGLATAMNVNRELVGIVRSYLIGKGVAAENTSLSDLALMADAELRADPVLKALRGDKTVSLQPTAVPASATERELNRFGFDQGLTEFLKNVAKKGGKDYSEIAKLLLDAGADAVDVRLVNLPNTEAAGFYIGSSGVVHINVAKAGPRGAVDTALHELLHAVTARSLRNPTTEAQAKVIKKLERVRQSVIKRAKAAGIFESELKYALSDNDEFITHFFTSEEFRNAVSSMTPTSERNWVQVITDLIADLVAGRIRTRGERDMDTLRKQLTTLIETPRVGLVPSEMIMRLPTTDAENVARFNQLTESLYAGRDTATQEEIDAWKEANPDKWAELSRMREEVLINMIEAMPMSDNDSPVPNTNSISADGGDFTEMGVRDVPTRLFSGKGKKAFYDVKDHNRVDALIESIREEGVRSPLIVVVDGHPDGVAYIMEGAHRIAAIEELGIEEFPALVLLETGEVDPISAGQKITPDQWADIENPDIRFQPTFENELNKYITGEWPADRAARESEGRAFVKQWLSRYDRLLSKERINTASDLRGELGDDSRRDSRGNTSSSASVLADGSISITFGSDMFEMLDASEVEAKTYIARAVQEEVIHATHLRAIANRVGENLEAVSADLKRTYDDIVTGLNNADFKEPFRVFANSMSTYRREAEVSPERLANPSIEGFAKTPTLIQMKMVGELARQSVQLRRSAGITEQASDWWKAITDWFNERLAVLKRIAAEPNQMGGLFARDIQDIENLLDASDIRFQPSNIIGTFYEPDFTTGDPQYVVNTYDGMSKTPFRRVFDSEAEALEAVEKITAEDNRPITSTIEQRRILGSKLSANELLTTVLPEGMTAADLNIDTEQLNEEIAPLDNDSAEAYVTGVVNQAVGRRAGETAIGEDSVITDAYEDISRGKFRDEAVYRFDRGLRDKLMQYLTAAIEAVFDRAAGNVATQVLVNRLSRALGSARDGFNGDINPSRGYDQEVRDVSFQPVESLTPELDNELRKYITGGLPSDPDLRTESLIRFAESWSQRYGDLAELRVLPTGEGLRADIFPNGDTVVSITRDSIRRFTKDARSDFEALRTVAIILNEEYFHAAELQALKETVGESDNYVTDTSELIRRIYDEMEGLSVGQPDIGETAFASSAFYKNRDLEGMEPFGMDDALGLYGYDFTGVVSELTRQVVQLQRLGSMSELESRRETTEWVKNLSEKIKLVADGSQNLGEAFARNVENTNAQLDTRGIKFQPSKQDALNAPSPKSGYLDIFADDQGTRASADKAESSNSWLRKANELFIKTHGALAESASKSKVNRDALNTATEETIARLAKKLTASIKSEEADPHLVQLASGNPDPLISEAIEKEIISQYEDEVSAATDLITEESAKIKDKDAAKEFVREKTAEAMSKIERRRKMRIWRERKKAADARRKQQMEALSQLERSAPETYEALIDMRAYINDLQQRVKRLNVGNPEIQAIIDQSMSVYLVRSYAVHQDPKQIDLMLNSQDPEYARRREALISFFAEKAKEDIMRELERDPDFIRSLGDEYDSAKIDREMQRVINADDRVGKRALAMFEDFMVGKQTEKGLFGSGSDVANEITRYMKKMNMPQQFLDAMMVNTDPVFNMVNTGMSLGRLIVNANMLAEIAASGIESGRYISKAEKDSGVTFNDGHKLLREVFNSEGNEDVKKDVRDRLFVPLYRYTETAFTSGILQNRMSREEVGEKLDAALREFGSSTKSLGEILPELGNRVDRLATDLFISSDKLTMKLKDKLVPMRGRFANWQPLVSSNEGNSAYAPLGGLYASPEQVNAFQATFKTGAKSAEHFAQQALGWMNKKLIGAAGVSLGIATLGSPAYFVRNVFGGMFYAGMNGVNFADPKLRKAASDFIKATLINTDQITPEFQELIAGRIIMDASQIGYLKQLIEDMGNSPSDTLDKLNEIAGLSDQKLNKALKVSKQAGKAALRKLQAFAEVTEVYPAVMTYLDFKNKLTEANFGTEREIQQEASRRTKLVMPSKSEASTAVSAFTGSGLGAMMGAFIRFKAENIRNTINSYKLAKEWRNSDNPVLRKYGQRKTAAWYMVAGLITVAMPLIAKALQGIDDDEDEAIRSSLPSYLKNASLYYYVGDDGVKIFNLSFTNPYSFGLDPISRSADAILTGDLEELPGIAAHFITEDLLGENIVAGKLIDAKRNVDSSTGRPIFFESDSGSVKTLKQAQYIGQAYWPRLFTQMGRFWDATQRDTEGAEFSYTPFGVVLGTGAPFKIIEKSFDDMERASFNDIRKKKSELWMITSPVFSPAPLSGDEAVELYEKRSEKNMDISKETLERVEGFRKLRTHDGGSESQAERDIKKSAKSAGLSEARFNRLMDKKVDDRLVFPDEDMRKVKDIDPDRYDALREAIRSKPRYIPVE